MVIFRRKQNYRNITLRPDTQGETVGVVLKSRDVRYILWVGLISRDDARELPHGRPVKLEVHSYQIDGDPWIELQPGEYVQGCLVVGAGVYGVVHDDKPRLVQAKGRRL